MKKRVLLLVLAVLALTFALVSCGHEHDFQEKEVVTAPTCDVAGKTLYACECGATEEREVAATGHTGGEVATKEPTCRDDGYKYKVCSVCNAEYDITDKVSAGSNYHKFDERKMTTPVDCGKVPMQNGIINTVCSLCGEIDSTKKPELVIAEHDFEVTTIAATCSAAGSVTRVCKNCQAPGPSEVLEKLPHTNELTGTTDATCTEAGFKSYICTVCNEVTKEETDPAFGHNFDTTNELIKDPTCELPGYKYYACSNENCTEEEKIPGIYGDAYGHDTDYSDSEYTEVVYATCITNGSITPICKRCNELLDTETDLDGKGYVRVLEATGEHYVTDEKIGSKGATCHERAYEEFKCTTDAACTATEKRYSGEKLEHVFPETPTAVIAPKCYADGYDLYVCTICELDTSADSTCEDGCVKKDNFTTVPHQKSTLIDEVEATCCDQAYDIWECGDCKQQWNDVYSTDVKPLMEHGSWYKTDDVTAPTCTDEGYTIYICKNDPDCIVTDKQDYTRRIAHPFTEYVDGRLVCGLCDITYRDVTTYIEGSVADGELKIDEETSLDWELKGYKAPTEAIAIVGGGSYDYVVGGANLDITNGIIKLSSEAQAIYTIVVEFEGGSKEFTVDSADAYFDLYVNKEGEVNGIDGTVTKVTVTATADATVVFYAYEG